MATPHTPGPWEVAGRARIVHPIEDGRGQEIVAVAEASDLQVAKADALLIAAAPDLLTALRDAQLCLEFFGLQLDDDDDPKDVAEFARVMAANRAAISKAVPS